MSRGFLCFVGYFYLYGGIFNCNVLLRRWNLYWFGWLVCMGRVFALHVRGLGCTGNGIIDGYVRNANWGIILLSLAIHIDSRKVGSSSIQTMYAVHLRLVRIQ
jgi:hypothetical protein